MLERTETGGVPLAYETPICRRGLAAFLSAELEVLRDRLASKVANYRMANYLVNKLSDRGKEQNKVIKRKQRVRVDVQAALARMQEWATWWQEAQRNRPPDTPSELQPHTQTLLQQVGAVCVDDVLRSGGLLTADARLEIAQQHAYNVYMKRQEQARRLEELQLLDKDVAALHEQLQLKVGLLEAAVADRGTPSHHMYVYEQALRALQPIRAEAVRLFPAPALVAVTGIDVGSSTNSNNPSSTPGGGETSAAAGAGAAGAVAANADTVDELTVGQVLHMISAGTGDEAGGDSSGDESGWDDDDYNDEDGYNSGDQG